MNFEWLILDCPKGADEIMICSGLIPMVIIGIVGMVGVVIWVYYQSHNSTKVRKGKGS